MPDWMNKLKLAFVDKSFNTINSKIFIVKLIINCETNFEPYAKHWLSPLMQFVLDKHLGNNLNYFITDVVRYLKIYSCLIMVLFVFILMDLKIKMYYRFQCLFRGIKSLFRQQRMKNI